MADEQPGHLQATWVYSRVPHHAACHPWVWWRGTGGQAGGQGSGFSGGAGHAAGSMLASSHNSVTCRHARVSGVSTRAKGKGWVVQGTCMAYLSCMPPPSPPRICECMANV